MHRQLKIALNVLTLGGGMIGSILIASNIGVGVYGYILFLMSSITSSVLLWSDKEQRALLALNLFYIAVNIFGLIRLS